VANDEGSLGYIGFSYVQQNVDKLTAVAVDSGTGAIAPSNETIENGTYAPLSRPLLLYISKKSYDEKPQVKAFVSFILSEKGRGLISAQGYVPLPAEAYTLAQARLDAATLNSVFAGAKPGTPITEVLKATP
jgi:phosphate transport system substrate-binding protein